MSLITWMSCLELQHDLWMQRCWAEGPKTFLMICIPCQVEREYSSLHSFIFFLHALRFWAFFVVNNMMSNGNLGKWAHGQTPEIYTRHRLDPKTLASSASSSNSANLIRQGWLPLAGDSKWASLWSALGSQGSWCIIAIFIRVNGRHLHIIICMYSIACIDVILAYKNNFSTKCSKWSIWVCGSGSQTV